MEKGAALRMIESLRTGLPPARGVELYSVGYDSFIDGVKKHHIENIQNLGIFRSISGSWGAGKSHLFRLLLALGFSTNCLVSYVELKKDSTTLNKFETLVFSIIRNITTPQTFKNLDVFEDDSNTARYQKVLEESFAFLATGSHSLRESPNNEHLEKATAVLMACHNIDIDFKKMIKHYWTTLVMTENSATVEQTKGEIIQWFYGEGTIGTYKKRFGVNKLISRENAKWMFQSLGNFVRLSGYRGLVVLFDEAEQSYSVMSKSALKDAQNNLVYLFNNIVESPGIFLVYAATPDFWTDPKYGVKSYGALAQRIGHPEQKPPSSLKKVWNIDQVEIGLPDYQTAAKRILPIYLTAYPEFIGKRPSEDDVEHLVEDLFTGYAKSSPVSFWRFMITALIGQLDDILEGTIRPVEQLKRDVMDVLREQ